MTNDKVLKENQVVKETMLHFCRVKRWKPSLFPRSVTSGLTGYWKEGWQVITHTGEVRWYNDKICTRLMSEGVNLHVNPNTLVIGRANIVALLDATQLRRMALPEIDAKGILTLVGDNRLIGIVTPSPKVGGAHQLAHCVQIRSTYDLEVILLKLADCLHLRDTMRLWLEQLHREKLPTGGESADEKAADTDTDNNTDYGELWQKLIPKIGEIKVDKNDKMSFEMTPISDGHINMAYAKN